MVYSVVECVSIFVHVFAEGHRTEVREGREEGKEGKEGEEGEEVEEREETEREQE